MWKSKARERVCKRSEAQAQDRLLRHYQKIGAPAVAAALNVSGAQTPDETPEPDAQQPVAVPAFLLSDDCAA